MRRESQQLNTIEPLFLCANIFNRSTIVVDFNFPREKLQASFERCWELPHGYVQIVRLHTEPFWIALWVPGNPHGGLSAENGIMVSAREQWEKNPARVAVPHSHPNKIRGMIAFQRCCAQLLLTPFKSISSCSNMQMAPDPRRGTPTGARASPQKSWALSLPKANIKPSSGSRSPGRKGSLKRLRKARFPLCMHRVCSVGPCSPIAKGIILD